MNTLRDARTIGIPQCIAAIGLAALLTPVGAAAQPPSDASGGLLDRPMRALHVSGNWGTHPDLVERWDRQGPLIPPDFVTHLRELHIDWIGISVALHYDDSMDSTVERAYDTWRNVPTWEDDVLRQLLREFRALGIDVYLTLAFESHEAYRSARPAERWQLGDPGDPDTGVPADGTTNIRREFWPWNPEHPDHDRFVAEFWRTYTDQAVHFARMCQQEGVRMYSLGTETEALFRTRPTDEHWRNDFADELHVLVDRVRAVYDGLVTYNMHSFGFTREYREEAWSRHLWDDVDLDVIGTSAWFPLLEREALSTVPSVSTLQQQYEQLFRNVILPVAERHPDRPIVFTEYSVIDTTWGPSDPARGLGPDDPEYWFVFSDKDGNGLDDGRETQANMIRALFNTLDAHPDTVYGAFFWDNWIAGDEQWQEWAARIRNFDIRDKPSEEVVRSAYASWRDRHNRPPRPVGALGPLTLGVDDGPVSFDVAVAFHDPDGDPLTYGAAPAAPGVVATAVSGSTLTVTPVAAGTVTVTVTAADPLGLSATQTFRVAVTAPATGSFTDDPLVPGVTPVRAIHFTELRTRIDALRATAGLPRFVWTDPILRTGMTPVRLVHLLELRSALADAYAAAGRSAPPYTDAAPQAGRTSIRTTHLMELRAAVAALE